MDKRIELLLRRDGGPYRALSERAPTDEDALANLGEFPEGASDPPELPPEGVSRRRFLGLLSATAALAAGTACSRPDRGSVVPYARRPEEATPGVANYYASTFAEGFHAHRVLVKTREGRPVHVEGNDEDPWARGKAPFRALADLLGLYDPDRLRQPLVEGGKASWAEAEGRVLPILRRAAAEGRPVLLLCDAVLSPSRMEVLKGLGEVLPGLQTISFEAASGLGSLGASRSIWGRTEFAGLHPGKARVILSLEADFLSGEDPSAVLAFVEGRRPADPDSPMTRLYAVEGRMTLTGAKADRRLKVRPSRSAAFAFGLAGLLHSRHGVPLPAGLDPGVLARFDAAREVEGEGAESVVEALAADLARAGAGARVLAGGHLPQEAHGAAHLIHAMVGAEAPAPVIPLVLPASHEEVLRALDAAAGGTYSLVLHWRVNPALVFPGHAAFTGPAADRSVRIGLLPDETAAACGVVLPENHWLESWGDYAPGPGLRSLQQPAVAPLYDTRQGEDVLLAWTRELGGTAPSDFREQIRSRWRREEFPAGAPVPFEAFWNSVLHDGVFEREAGPAPVSGPDGAALARMAEAVPAGPAGRGFELALFPSPAVLDGRYGNNGWLQEWPDPITKATWGNPLLLSPEDAQALGAGDGDVVRLETGKAALEAPVLLQPGQARGLAALALGYGRKGPSVAEGIGVNAFALMDAGSKSPFLREGVRLAPAGRRIPVPTTQTHHRMEGRDLVRSFSLREWARRDGEDGHEHELHSLYPGLEFPDHKWGMAIDLSACVGCSGCVLACQSENNVPVVGPEQVLKGREMHWIRVDRYYEGRPEAPKVVHQPMLCQHCDHAPCENVCPVNATNHSPDGLNQMAYNRCVGTRYCANNCPYKVRRFNFLEWNNAKTEPETLVFNPEVSVRPRGVMEKCTFCIQRIQDVRMRAKVEGRAVRDGEIRPACAAACPAEAIAFGDLKDPESRVSKMSKDGRGYKVLAELGVRPAVTYLADIRNPGEKDDG
ncbi:MAG: Fe-S-cluster-containing hydrogenase [Acidobacteriota bacterium]